MSLITEHRHAIERVARARTAYEKASHAASSAQRVVAAADDEVEAAAGELRAVTERAITENQHRTGSTDGVAMTPTERRHDE